MNPIFRLMVQINQRMTQDLLEERAVEAGLMREPSGIGTSKHNVEPHPSSAPYPYIIDDGRTE